MFPSHACVCVWLMVSLQRAAVSSGGGGKKTFHVEVSPKASVNVSFVWSSQHALLGKVIHRPGGHASKNTPRTLTVYILPLVLLFFF